MKLIVCVSCEGEFKLKHSMDEGHYAVSFCPFCGEELDDEFKDEIEEWVIQELKSIGCDTAKSVLDISAEDLVSRTNLEIETVKEVLNILVF